MKTLRTTSPPSIKSSRPDEEYIHHLLEECDEPPRLYEHLCWYIHTWGSAAVKPLARAACSPKVRRTALYALQNAPYPYFQEGSAG